MSARRRSTADAIPLAGLFCALALTGCIHVNLPEHMVSDVVDAGKDAYHAIEEAVSKPKQRVFVHTCIREGEVPVDEVQKACVDELVTQARTALKVEKLDYSVDGHTVDKVAGSVVVNCQISLKG